VLPTQPNKAYTERRLSEWWPAVQLLVTNKLTTSSILANRRHLSILISRFQPNQYSMNSFPENNKQC